MGLIKRLKDGLKKTRENFSKKMFNLFRGKHLDANFYQELEDILIASDLGIIATEDIILNLKDAVHKEKITNPADVIEELKEILIASIDYEIAEYEYPLILLITGVNGVGKTTVVGKLAKLFISRGKSVIIAGADTFRAAASEQLEIWGERAGARVVTHSEGSDPAAVVFDTLASAKAKNTKVIIIDTAGRLHNKKNLMEELKKINRIIDREFPEADRRNLIVLDATTGQNALVQIDVFNLAIDIDGIILTKLDGTAKGGVIMAAASEYNMPVYYVGVGEGIDDLLHFDAKEFIETIMEDK